MSFSKIWNYVVQLVWFCLSIGGRFQEYDRDILNLLQSEPDLRKRVAVVLTKCDQDDENGSAAQAFKQAIRTSVGTLPVFEVSTDPDLKLDLEELMLWSADQLDDKDLREAFITSQMISLKAKHDTAAIRIGFYSAAAAGIGAAPIPFADSALLVPLQVTLSADIIRLYGMDNYASVSKALVGNIVISNLGKSLAGGLLKLIPGVGTIVGGAINASVAALITSALGFAISEICYRSCQKIAKGEYVDFSEIFDQESIKEATNLFLSTHKSVDVNITEESRTYAKKYLNEHKKL